MWRAARKCGGAGGHSPLQAGLDGGSGGGVTSLGGLLAREAAGGGRRQVISC